MLVQGHSLRPNKGLSELRCLHIQEKQKSRGITTASLEFFVGIAQVVHKFVNAMRTPLFFRFVG